MILFNAVYNTRGEVLQHSFVPAAQPNHTYYQNAKVSKQCTILLLRARLSTFA